MLAAAVAVQVRAIVASEHIEAAAPLLREHWLEIARHKEVMQLKPNVAAYRELEARGATISLGAFDGDTMVGYCVGLIARHLHYADLVYVSNDILFVARTHRHQGIGKLLRSETERLAKERGAGLAIWHAKQGTALDHILFEDGYAVQDVLYGRRL